MTIEAPRLRIAPDNFNIDPKYFGDIPDQISQLGYSQVHCNSLNPWRHKLLKAVFQDSYHEETTGGIELEHDQFNRFCQLHNVEPNIWQYLFYVPLSKLMRGRNSQQTDQLKVAIDTVNIVVSDGHPEIMEKPIDEDDAIAQIELLSSGVTYYSVNSTIVGPMGNHGVFSGSSWIFPMKFSIPTREKSRIKNNWLTSYRKKALPGIDGYFVSPGALPQISQELTPYLQVGIMHAEQEDEHEPLPSESEFQWVSLDHENDHIRQELGAVIAGVSPAGLRAALLDFIQVSRADSDLSRYERYRSTVLSMMEISS